MCVNDWLWESKMKRKEMNGKQKISGLYSIDKWENIYVCQCGVRVKCWVSDDKYSNLISSVSLSVSASKALNNRSESVRDAQMMQCRVSEITLLRIKHVQVSYQIKPCESQLLTQTS